MSAVITALHSVTEQSLCIQCLQRHATAECCPHCGFNPDNYHPHPLYLKPETVLQNQYLIGKILGQGGFGITYIGLDLLLNKRVAIKEYLPSALASRAHDHATVVPLKNQTISFAKGLRAFIEEARNLARFKHPHIVQVSNYFEANQTAYMVMDYIEGDNPLSTLRTHDGHIKAQQALDILLPILDALDAVHAQHILHLDVSAHNILLTADGTPVLIDFGAARGENRMQEATRSMSLVLKPGYSPLEQYAEQARQKMGAWTDIYACGALLFLMLTGRLPPSAPERWDVDRLPNLPPPKTEDPARWAILQNAIHKSLALRAADRYQTVAEFRAALLAEARPSYWQRAVPYQLPFTLLILLMINVLLWGQWTEPKTVQSTITTLFLSPDQPSQFKNTALPHNPPSEELPTLFLRDAALYAEAQKMVALFKQAQVFLGANQIDAAYQNYQAILHIAPKHQPTQQALNHLSQSFLLRSQTAIKAGEISHAFALAQQARHYFPQNTAVQNLWQQTKTLQQTQKPTTLDNLLQQIDRQLAASKLSLPRKDNAYASYQHLRSAFPNHPRVQSLPNEIAQAYQTLAKQKVNQKEQLKLINKGLRIQPNHVGLLALQTQLTPVPVSQSAPEIMPQNNLIDTLLKRARQQLNQQDWQAAAASYNAVLNRQAKQAEALAGLAEIAAIYRQKARTKQTADESILALKQSLKIVIQGLSLVPNDSGLLVIEHLIRQKLVTKNQAATLPDLNVVPPDNIIDNNSTLPPTGSFAPSF
jgi:serine/threonine protein kinase